MHGTSGCARTAAKATVTGRNITQVEFRLDGKHARVARAAGTNRKRFSVTYSTKGLKTGLHRITARVRYARASATKPRTHTITFQRCARAAVAPTFAG
jgi:hypothetical protein